MRVEGTKSRVDCNMARVAGNISRVLKKAPFKIYQTAARKGNMKGVPFSTKGI